MLLGRDAGIDFIMFDDIIDDDIISGNVDRHHQNPSSWWSLYVSGMMLANNRYHTVYRALSFKDHRIMMEGYHILLQMGIESRGSGENGLIDEIDIVRVFTQLGGGTEYILSDGRTASEIRGFRTGGPRVPQQPV